MTHGGFDMLNLLHQITIMIINTGQKCTVSYSDRVCHSYSPDSEKIWRTKKKTDFDKMRHIKDNFFCFSP